MELFSPESTKFSTHFSTKKSFKIENANTLIAWERNRIASWATFVSAFSNRGCVVYRPIRGAGKIFPLDLFFNKKVTCPFSHCNHPAIPATEKFRDYNT